MKTKKAAYIWAVIIAVVLLFVITHIRVIKIADQSTLLFDSPLFRESSSVGNDIRRSFDEAGKNPDGIVDIAYSGSNSNGNYFQCTYKESDGSVNTYYALDDGDLNSTVRATVLWDEP